MSLDDREHLLMRCAPWDAKGATGGRFTSGDGWDRLGS